MPGGAPALLWLSLSALACTTGTHTATPQGGTTGGASTGLDASTTGGSAATAGQPAGAGGSAGTGALDSGSTSVPDSTVANVPDDGGVRPTDASADATMSGPIDAAAPPSDAATDSGPPQPGCPPQLPPVDMFCSSEGLACQYGMECCPDFAYCEFGRWTLLTHHCDACI